MLRYSEILHDALRKFVQEETIYNKHHFTKARGHVLICMFPCSELRLIMFSSTSFIYCCHVGCKFSRETFWSTPDASLWIFFNWMIRSHSCFMLQARLVNTPDSFLRTWFSWTTIGNFQCQFIYFGPVLSLLNHDHSGIILCLCARTRKEVWVSECKKTEAILRSVVRNTCYLRLGSAAWVCVRSLLNVINGFDIQESSPHTPGSRWKHEAWLVDIT